jgi:hypothetical protein
LAVIQTVAETSDARLVAALSANPSSGDISASASGAQTAGTAVVNGLPGAAVSDNVTIDMPSSSSIWTTTMYGVGTINLDPANNPLIATAATWIKSAVQWIALSLYAWWIYGQMNRRAETMMLVPQAKGNAVVGGTGGQATAALSAVAITVAIFLAVPTLWAVAGTPGMTHYWDGANSVFSSSSSVVGGALYLLGFFVPVAFILNLVGHMFVFKKGALAICFGVHALIKYIVF